MPPRIPTPSRTLGALARTYATPAQTPPPAPFSAPLSPPPSSPSSSYSGSVPSSPAPRVKPNASYSGPDRVYTDRKAFLWEYYGHLVSQSKLLLLFEHDNLKNTDLNRIRTLIKQLPPPSISSTGRSKKKRVAQPATFTICRTGVFSAVANDKFSNPTSPSSSQPIDLGPFLTGQRALITCPDLSPGYLNGILRAIEKGIKQSKRQGDDAVKQPKLNLVVGILEGNKLFEPKAIERIAKLPELDQLRGQVVGMLEQQGRSLVGILSQAGGGALVRTLQGLEQGLKAEQGAEGEGKAE